MDKVAIAHILAAFKNVIPPDAARPTQYRLRGPDHPMELQSLREYVIFRDAELMGMEVRVGGAPVEVYYLMSDGTVEGPRRPFVLTI